MPYCLKIAILHDRYGNGRTVLKLGEMIHILKEKGFFGETFEDIDFFYDNSAVALGKLYLGWMDTQKLHYDNEKEAVWKKITAFLICCLLSSYFSYKGIHIPSDILPGCRH